MQTDFGNDIEECISVLRNGGIILYPTDTIWGIGCDATNEKAVERIFQLKNRPDQKALIVLVADEMDVLKHVAHTDLRVFDYVKQSPRPVTVVYEGAIGLADNLVGKDGSVAIRITDDTFCKHLIKRFRKPIVSTSANVSGEPPARYFSEIKDEIKNGVDFVVKYRQDDDSIASPSMVIRWNKDATVTVLRS
jgi:L-threonylcarbamoyladenylate synthase